MGLRPCHAVSEVTMRSQLKSRRAEEHVCLLRELGLRFGMVVPRKAHNGTFGALTVVLSESEARYGEDDLALAQELAR
jgi:hypothetical protein